MAEESTGEPRETGTAAPQADGAEAGAGQTGHDDPGHGGSRRSKLRISRRLRVILTKFAATSVAATLTSQGVTVLLYWTHLVTAGVTVAIAWLSGAIVTYVLSRRWTWQRKGRASMRGEVLPYLAIVGLYGVGTVVLTKLMHMAVGPLVEGTPFRGIALNVSLFIATGLLIGLKFLGLHRVFGGRRAKRTPATTSPS